MRGGVRRRYIEPGRDAATWCAGRWGPRRVRVSQCWATLRAEDVYTEAMRVNLSVTRPGARGGLTFTLCDRSFEIQWQIRSNAVWRFGRLFLICPHCSRRVTRIYVPTAESSARCRACWGLSYSSRQNSYKRTGLSAFLGPIGASETEHAEAASHSGGNSTVRTARNLASRAEQGQPNVLTSATRPSRAAMRSRWATASSVQDRFSAHPGAPLSKRPRSSRA